LLAVALFALAGATATPAMAQQPGFGVRAGVSGSPDQFYFGAHYDTGPVFDRVSFRPNAEIGVGDNQTTVTGNFEFVYWVRIPRHPWNVYLGGGPAVVFEDFHDDTHVGPGFNLLMGVAHRSGFMAEIKAGLIDSPGFKFGVGYTWR
jgi:hypothetical protein